MEYYTILILTLVAWNIVTFVLYGIDKYRSAHNKWRISEKALILVALFMGAFGALFGMQIFRHKTKQPKFYIGLPLCLFFNVGVVVLINMLHSRVIGN